MNRKLTEALKIAIRDEYVHGYADENGVRQYPTFITLAKTYNVSKATLSRRSTREDWQGQKNKVQTEIQITLDEDRITKMVADSKMLDDTAIKIAQAMLLRVGHKLQRAQTDEKVPKGIPFVESLSIQDLLAASNVAQNAQKLGKLALGQAQEISKVSADVSNPEAFSRVMEQLDELANARTQGSSKSLH